MKSNLALLLLACATLPCWAQTAPSPARALPVAESPSERGEPNVKRTVTEDEGSRIDELRVRGQLTQVTVTPKVGLTKSYEIIVSRSGREPVDGTGGANSAVGKRVWNVLAF
jgi:Protein of unknown function (DUF2782)